jgi:hypothetical protein
LEHDRSLFDSTKIPAGWNEENESPFVDDGGNETDINTSDDIVQLIQGVVFHAGPIGVIVPY